MNVRMKKKKKRKDDYFISDSSSKIKMKLKQPEICFDSCNDNNIQVEITSTQACLPRDFISHKCCAITQKGCFAKSSHIEIGILNGMEWW